MNRKELLIKACQGVLDDRPTVQSRKGHGAWKDIENMCAVYLATAEDHDLREKPVRRESVLLKNDVVRATVEKPVKRNGDHMVAVVVETEHGRMRIELWGKNLELEVK